MIYTYASITALMNFYGCGAFRVQIYFNCFCLHQMRTWQNIPINKIFLYTLGK